MATINPPNAITTRAITIPSNGATAKGYIGNFSDQLYLTAGGYYDNGWVYDSSTTRSLSSIQLGSANGLSTISFQAAATVGSAPVTIMSMTPAGLGIGVSPAVWGSGNSALQVGTTGSIDWYSANSQIAFSNNWYLNTSGQSVYLTTAAASNYTQVGGLHIFNYAASGTAGNTFSFSEAMRIDASGALLIGRTAPINSEAFCASNSTATTATGYIYKSAVQTAGSTFVVRSEGVAGTGWQLYEGMAQSGSTVFYVQGNGNVKNTNNSYGAISDISLKENIADATPKLADLMNVKIRNYNFKSDDTKRKQIGVIAQELETVFPAMVDIDSKGNKTVGYSIFVPMLIKAIQELTTRLAALETK
jgi:hypothetical protein